MDSIQLLERLRNGDGEAAAILIERHGESLRRYVQRILPLEMRGRLGTSDVCQSVWTRFLKSAAAGKCDLGQADSLLELLRTIARRRIVSHRRRLLALKRSVLRESSHEDSQRIGDCDNTPAKLAARRDFWDVAVGKLAAHERQLIELRLRDRCQWTEIAERLGGTPSQHRMAFGRAIECLRKSIASDNR